MSDQQKTGSWPSHHGPRLCRGKPLARPLPRHLPRPCRALPATGTRLLRVLTGVMVVTCLMPPAAAQAQCAGGVCRPPATWHSAPGGPRSIEVQVGSDIAAAVCRVVNTTRPGTSVGSGALVRSDAKRSLVLTCEHLFREGVGTVTVRYRDGSISRARLVGRDAAHDLVLLECEPTNVRPLQSASDPPTTMATAVGLGSDGHLRAVRGRIVGRSTAVGARHPSLLIAGAVRSGDSGGPVINDQGQLVGVVWGVRDGVSYAMCGPPVTSILAAGQAGSRQAAAAPNDAPACNCGCDGDCVKRQALGDYARREELQGYAKREQLESLQGYCRAQVAQLWSRLESAAQVTPSKDDDYHPPEHAWLSIAVAGVGALGTLHAAWLALRVWRRRATGRRGLGGPRRERFPRAHPHRAAPLCVG